MQRM